MANVFTGNEDHDFPLSTAIEWTTNYRNSVPPTETRAHYFGKAAIEAIFAQETCVGMRVYYALDATGKKQLIIVGVDASGNDLYNGLIAERSMPCPNTCATASPLNS
ncbi:MAG: hypothetical protein JNL60_11545 [Bacteroidia bacterium]|nr:hypothetical protein [Bacteroidia bacterium]